MVVNDLNGENLFSTATIPTPMPLPGIGQKVPGPDLPEDAKRKILWDNTVKLYGSA